MAMYPNGRAPASALIRIYGCVASPDMARRVKYVKEEYDRTHADNLSINEIYRTYDQQVYQKERWTNLGQPGNAATPGYSNHGAWDIGAVDWSSIDIVGRREIAARVGLIHNISNESWHAAAIGTITVDLPSLDGLNSVELEGDEDMAFTPLQAAQLAQCVEILAELKNAIGDPNNGVLKNAHDAAEWAGNANVIASDVRNLVQDPDHGVLKRLNDLENR
jgi:hypothetical protein